MSSVPPDLDMLYIQAAAPIAPRIAIGIHQEKPSSPPSPMSADSPARLSTDAALRVDKYFRSGRHRPIVALDQVVDALADIVDLTAQEIYLALGPEVLDLPTKKVRQLPVIRICQGSPSSRRPTDRTGQVLPCTGLAIPVVGEALVPGHIARGKSPGAVAPHMEW